MKVRHLGVGTICALILVPAISASAQDATDNTSASALTLTDISGTTVSRYVLGVEAAAVVTATVHNRGSDTATQARVSYRLPAGIEFDEASTTVGCSPSATTGSAPGIESNGSTIECNLGSIAAGGSVPVAIGVRAAQGTTVLGSRTGYFFALRSNQFDPQAGEVRLTSWNHEAGGEGTSLTQCWPLANPTPMMDVSDGECDGHNDSPPLTPDAVTTFDAFPPAFAEVVSRSWQFETRISISETGQYLVCGQLADDGAYIAITPAGTAFTSTSIVLDIANYSSVVSEPFALDAGENYDVLIRVSNRGVSGIDNAGPTGSPGGWDSFGIGLAGDGCGPDQAQSYGTAATALISRQGADVIVAGSADIAIVGGIQSAAKSGQQRSSIRVRNLGLDMASATASVTTPKATSGPGPFTTCAGTVSDLQASCPIGRIDPNDDKIITVNIGAGTEWAGWLIDVVDAVDSTPGNNILPAS